MKNFNVRRAALTSFSVLALAFQVLAYQNCSGAAQFAALPSSTPANTLIVTSVALYSWSAGNYGLCTKVCGSGTQTRPLVCKDAGGATVANSNCSGLAQPPAQQTCGAALQVACTTNVGGSSQVGIATCSADGSGYGACASTAVANYVWTIGAWSSCSNTCGTGAMSRAVSCENATLGEAVDGSYCSASTAPTSSQSCQTTCASTAQGRYTILPSSGVYTTFANSCVTPGYFVNGSNTTSDPNNQSCSSGDTTFSIYATSATTFPASTGGTGTCASGQVVAYINHYTCTVCASGNFVPTSVVDSSGTTQQTFKCQ